MRDLEDFLLPQRCPGCGIACDGTTLLCPGCFAAIPRISFAVCARCLARDRDPVGCRLHPGRLVWPAWVYDEPAALVIQALKYRERVDLADVLGRELARVAPPLPRADLVIEVPLHPSRVRERGFNQAALLADALSRELQVPRVRDALERIEATPPQARLDARARRANVARAFRARHPEWLTGRRVLVVDDVVTTGATLDACLRVCERAGARAVGVVGAWAQ